MNIEISIEDFNSNEFDQLASLFGSHFRPDDKLLTKSYTEWLYARNPYGLARLVKAVAGNRWVGLIALIPVRLLRRDAELAAYYAVNVLVHPRYAGHCIFSRMITAAKDLVRAENAALMGHPNKLSLPFWSRSRMHFHETLKPTLVIPRFFAGGVRARDVRDVSQVMPVLQALQVQARQGERWSIAVTPEYIKWRYFGHTAYTYRLQLIEVDGASAGFVISRKVRPGVNLLVDQFMLDRHVTDGLNCLPWFTVSMKPEPSRRELAKSLWSLPIKKQFPFFFTCYQQPFSSQDVMNLGLSASDF